MELKWWQHLYRSVRFAKYTKWSIGLESRKTWKEKPYFDFVCAYHDGNHWCLHIGYFYIGGSYY